MRPYAELCYAMLGAFPSYVARGIIDGFPEQARLPRTPCPQTQTTPGAHLLCFMHGTDGCGPQTQSRARQLAYGRRRSTPSTRAACAGVNRRR
jgi:hypothetical protein